MAAPESKKLILPCLLDRLTDDNPDSQIEDRKNKAQTVREYRLSVLRDISWLLNSVCKLSGEEKEQYPQAAVSVLNYGAESMTGKASGSNNDALMRNSIINTLRTFEPRLDPDTIDVTIIYDKDASKGGSKIRESEIHFEIHGILTALPIPEELFIRTEFDLEEMRFNVYT